MESQLLLGVLYLVLGVAFLATRARVAQRRGRVPALVWLFLGVLLAANGALKVVQSLA